MRNRIRGNPEYGLRILRMRTNGKFESTLTWYRIRMTLIQNDLKENQTLLHIVFGGQPTLEKNNFISSLSDWSQVLLGLPTTCDHRSRYFQVTAFCLHWIQVKSHDRAMSSDRFRGSCHVTPQLKDHTLFFYLGHVVN